MICLKKGKGVKRAKQGGGECDYDYDDLSALSTLDRQSIWQLKYVTGLQRVWISDRGRYIKVQDYNQYRNCWGLGVIYRTKKKKG